MHNPSDIRIVTADDHPLLLQGLNDTLTRRGYELAGTANNGTEALQLILDKQPEIAILDIEMPYLTGLDIAEICLERGLTTKIIILSYHKEVAFIHKAQRLNLSGYLLKEDTTTEISTCIEALLNGETYYSPAIAQSTMEQSSEIQKMLDLLTPSEKKILKMIAESHSTEAIAELLHVSIRTIEKHRSNIIRKLDLNGQTHTLSIWAHEQKGVIKGL
ncbi:response regulator [Marinoscillum furvescens]|uniref:LuxR family two component transcriptional regulator n=1 Tax=Marinoscillum furvescens DSM 4134 TaxID=1122208 RepID=A0A3D9KZ76_MARFU|nr:response regulator transcription factor [Marinoscillum furvescens]RED95590.1 LuxR family two component transcriptional regulator [Marinoscillum furvescens DSM 4134]